MKTNREISERDIDEVVAFLNVLLADEYSLYTKTRNAYWNFKGENACGLHTFFESQHNALDLIIDDIALRVRSFGHFALGSIKEFMSVTHNESENQEVTNSRQIITILVGDHETIIQDIKKNSVPDSGVFNDYETAFFVSEIKEKHIRMIGMLRSYLA